MSTALNSEIADDPNNPQPNNNGFLGPSYPYKDNINPPDRVGITSKPGIDALTKDGVGLLIKIATEQSRAAKPSLKIGVCGEHGGDPRSIHFFHSLGLDYVSCSPFRVPIARLEAGRAAVNSPQLSASA